MKALLSSLITANQAGLPNASVSTAPQKIIGVLFFIGGTLAVIFTLIGAFQFVISNGDPKRVASARNTLLYALVGLIVISLAYAIVTFVVKST